MTQEQMPGMGNEVVAEACAAVNDLSGVPLDELAERLSAAHEQISSLLQNAPLVALPDRGPGA